MSNRVLMVDLFGHGRLANLFDSITRTELAELVVDLEMQNAGIDVHPRDLGAGVAGAMAQRLADRLEALRLRRTSERGGSR